MKHKHKWVAIKTIWPYPHGWGVYCKRCKTLVDSGLPAKHLAEQIAMQMNKAIKEKA